MTAVVVRLLVLAGGLGLGEIGLTSFALGLDVAAIQLAAALVLLVAGTAGFIVPLLAGHGLREEPDHG